MEELETSHNAEIIDLARERRLRWERKLRAMREVGEVAVFGAVGEQNATIIHFPERIEK